MRVLLTLDGRSESGGTPLIMHNEQLADPLNSFTRQLAKFTGKRKKTDADHLEIGRIEFMGGLYCNGNGPCLPAVNVLRCLQEGAKRSKRGADVLRGVVPLVQHADLAYEGPRVPDEMWKHGGFALRKSVGIGRSRTMRTRPIFHQWSAVLPVEVDPNVFNADSLAQVWHDAGIYAGLGDMRPIYGKFSSTLTEWTMLVDQGIGQAAYSLACAIAASKIQVADSERQERHGELTDMLQRALDQANKLHQEAAQVGV